MIATAGPLRVGGCQNRRRRLMLYTVFTDSPAPALVAPGDMVREASGSMPRRPRAGSWELNHHDRPLSSAPFFASLSPDPSGRAIASESSGSDAPLDGVRSPVFV